MLVSLYVENIAIIKRVSIDFCRGLSILTGETGAGKSLLIDSIGLLIGNKSRKELIGPFADYSLICAEFDDLPTTVLSLLSENSISLPDGKVFIERKITKDGRSMAKINSVPVPISLLQQLSTYLINIHGQHDHVQMLNSAIHIDFLDRYAELDGLLSEYRTEYKALRSLRKDVEQLEILSKQREDAISRLTFKLQEFQKIQPYIGMHDDLIQRKKILQNSENVNDFLRLLQPDDDDSISSILQNLYSKSQKLASIDDRFKGICESLLTMQQAADDISVQSDDIAADFSSSESLDDIESNLYSLERLLAKYGPGEEDLLQQWQETEQQLEKINSLDETIEQKKAEYISQLHTVQSLSSQLSDRRRNAAEKLSRNVKDELSFLDMNGVDFSVNVESNQNEKGGFVYNDHGHDKVEFLLSGNVGQSLKPLSKIASGGELSRIMLSITDVLNAQQECSTLIFDEVDTGVSGKTAEKVGFKLKEVSKEKQVLCITHLAQIASLGDNHYRISKSVVKDHTETSVDLLSDSERIEEVARIIGGINITDSVRSTAEEMLKTAK